MSTSLKEGIMKKKDDAKLDLLWNEFMKGMFESFVDMNIQRDAEGRPACLGTGDGHRWRPYCPYVAFC